MSRKKIVIIGGGATGHQIAYQLRDTADVTLIDPKTYWEVPMAVPRLLVDPDALQARIPYAQFLGSAHLVQGKAIALSEDSVQILTAEDKPQTISFDYAVVATGSAYLDPLIKAQAATEHERVAELQTMNNRLRIARSVVVVGAGPVGIEIAAELRESLPHVAVTLIHAGHSILENAPDKFSAWAEHDLRSKGVEFILNDVVITPLPGAQPEADKVETSSGRSVDADTVIWAVGTRPVTDFIARSWPEAVQVDGLVKVDPYLRVVGHPKVFAAGDLTNLPENRLAIIGGLHAKSIAANIKMLIASDKQSRAKLKPYRPAVPGKGMGSLMIVTLGRKDGLSSLPFGQFRASFIARKIKARDMLVGASRKAVGL